MRRSLATAVLATAATLTAACGSDGKDSTTAAPVTATVTATAPATTATPTQTAPTEEEYFGPVYLLAALRDGGFECTDYSSTTSLDPGSTAALCKTSATYGGVYVGLATYDSPSEMQAAFATKGAGNILGDASSSVTYLGGGNWIVSCLPGGTVPATQICTGAQRILGGELRG